LTINGAINGFGHESMRILVADDEASVRSALCCLISQQPGQRVVGEAMCWDDALRLLPSRRADVLLVDWELPGLSAERLARLPAGGPGIVVLSSRPEAARPALAAGADAFVCKSDAPDRLLAAIDAAARARGHARRSPPDSV